MLFTETFYIKFKLAFCQVIVHIITFSVDEPLSTNT